MATKSTPDEVEVVPETGDAPTPQTGSHVAAIIADHSVYRARYDLTFAGVTAYAAGQPVPASHPMAESWLLEGQLEVVES